MKGFILVGEVVVNRDRTGRVLSRGNDKPLLIGTAYITSAHPHQLDYGQGLLVYGTAIEYVGNEGYRTRNTFVGETFDIVSALIEEAVS
jgi:hypothetical protein